MAYPIGVIIAISAIVGSIIHLNQEAKNFWDVVGFLCVVGGTVAVAIITIPWQHRSIVFRSLGALFVPASNASGWLVRDCIEFISAIKSGAQTYESSRRDLAAATLRDGAELMSLGFEKSKVHEILEERIHQAFERQQSVSNAFRSLAKYPPAFGLAGTVLGLVTLMRGVSGGADAKMTGTMMAIALMATFYGLLVANMIVNPAGEHMLKTAIVERKRAEVALHAVLLAADRASLLEAQEVLNSYVLPNERVNVVTEEFATPISGAA